MKKITFNGWKIGRRTRYNLHAINKKINNPYYYLSNDVVSRSQFRTLNNDNGIFIGVGNIHALHIISQILRNNNLRELNFIDINISQLNHLDNTIKLIKKCESRIRFVEKYFSLDINDRGKDILSKINNLERGVTGYRKNKRLAKQEKSLWENAKFNSKKYYKSTGIKAKEFSNGIQVEGNPNFGGITKMTYHIIDCSTAIVGFEPFTLGYGSGFLSDEATYLRLRTELDRLSTNMIVGDITIECIKLLPAVRYFPIHVWTSNIFDPYFMKKFTHLCDFKQMLIELGTQMEPAFPEYQIYAYVDERTKTHLPRVLRIQRSKLSSHTYAFQVVASLISEKTVELVTNTNWIEEDNGESKLYLTEYARVEDLPKILHKYDCFFLHCLIGGGMSKKDFVALVKKLIRVEKRIIILEHNGESRDFKSNRNNYFSLDEIQNALGKAKDFQYVRGQHRLDRNILLVY